MRKELLKMTAGGLLGILIALTIVSLILGEQIVLSAFLSTMFAWIGMGVFHKIA